MCIHHHSTYYLNSRKYFRNAPIALWYFLIYSSLFCVCICMKFVKKIFTFFTHHFINVPLSAIFLLTAVLHQYTKCLFLRLTMLMWCISVEWSKWNIIRELQPQKRKKLNICYSLPNKKNNELKRKVSIVENTKSNHIRII